MVAIHYDCKLVPDILHAKVIWWVDAGAYIGSANLSDRAWISNIEAGTFLPHDELVETGMERELQRFFEEVDGCGGSDPAKGGRCLSC